MRLHFLIFAALMGVPFVALPYATKVTGFIESLDLRSPPLSQVTVGRLIAHVDSSWDKKRLIAEQIRIRLPELKERAQSIASMFQQMVAIESEKNKESHHAPSPPPQ